jgi:hypothetical protein
MPRSLANDLIRVLLVAYACWQLAVNFFDPLVKYDSIVSQTWEIIYLSLVKVFVKCVTIKTAPVEIPHFMFYSHFNLSEYRCDELLS